MNQKSQSQSNINESKNDHSQQNSQIKVSNQKEMPITLLINNQEFLSNHLKSTKFNDFMNSIKDKHFLDLSQETQLILAQGWNPIIPQSKNLPIEETLGNTIPKFNVWKLNDYLLQMSHSNIQLNNLNTQLEDQIKKDKLKYQELEIKYNKLNEEYISMKNNCQKYFEIINQKMMGNSTTDVSRIQFASNLLNDKNTVEQYPKLQQIQELQTLIQQFNQEHLEFKNQILKQEQLQQQIITVQDAIRLPQPFQNSKTSSSQKEQEVNPIITEIYKSNNPRIRILTKNEISQQEIFENTHLFKTTNKHNPESGQQPSNCSYCKKYCPEYIELPCLQRYHQYCFEELGRKLYIDQQPTAKCICSNKISTKLFTKETQFLLLSHQAALILQKYRESDQLRRCKDCEFFYRFDQPTDDCHQYCPNCLKFITES